MLSVFVTGLATGMLFAAVALVYNVMFSTSKVLSVTTGHISMLGGVFGAWFIGTLGWRRWCSRRWGCGGAPSRAPSRA